MRWSRPNGCIKAGGILVAVPLFWALIAFIPGPLLGGLSATLSFGGAGAVRNDAPISLLVTLSSDENAGPRHGTLRFRMVSRKGMQEKVRFDHSYGPIVVPPDGLRLPVLLPPMQTKELLGSKAKLRVEFLDRNGQTTRLLEDYTPDEFRESALSIVVISSSIDGWATRWAMFGFEKVVDHGTMARQDLIRSYPAKIAPNRAPATPLGYCAHDLVMIDPSAWKALSPRQRKALLDWTAAGGSTVVQTGDETNNLVIEVAARGIEAPIFEYLSIADDFQTPLIPLIRGYHFEIGRVLLLPPEMPWEAVIESREARTDDSLAKIWGCCMAFMWKFSNRATFQIVNHGSVGSNDHLDPQRSITTYCTAQNKRLFDLLAPASVTPPHLATVTWILAGFALLIGPVDFLLLGALHRRWLTWIFFPIVCILIAAVIYKIGSNRLDAQRKSVGVYRIIDIGSNGKPLNRSTAQLLYFPSEKEVVLELKNKLFAPVPGVGVTPPDEWRVEGRFPGSFTATRRVPPSTPLLVRTYEIAPEDAPSLSINWNGLDPSQHGFEDAVKDAVYEVEPNALVWIGKDSVFPDQISFPMALTEFRNRGDKLYEVDHVEACRLRTPSGEGSMNDIRVEDPTATGYTRLAILIRKGKDYTLFRRTFFAEP